MRKAALKCWARVMLCNRSVWYVVYNVGVWCGSVKGSRAMEADRRSERYIVDAQHNKYKHGHNADVLVRFHFNCFALCLLEK